MVVALTKCATALSCLRRGSGLSFLIRFVSMLQESPYLRLIFLGPGITFKLLIEGNGVLTTVAVR